MSFLSVLGKIGAGIAAPFTGGASLAAIPVIDAIGATASGAAAGAQQGRTQQDLANAQIYGSQIQGQLGLGNLDLNRKKFELDAGGKRVSDVTRAELLRNIGDFSMGGPGKWQAKGGLRPSALGPDAKEAARLLIARQLSGLQGPEQFAELSIPEMPKQTKAGWFEKLLGGIGMGASMASPILGGLRLPAKPLPGPLGSGMYKPPSL